MVGVLVDGALELLKELVNIEKVALCPQVGEGQRVGMHGRVRGLSNHSAALAVLGHAALVAAENRKLDTLEAHEALANVVVGRRVNSTALSIAKELVQSVVRSTLSDLVVVGQLLGLVDSIVNGSIGGVLGWASVESGGGTSWVLLAIASVGAESAIRILVSARCGGKRLQVSDHYTCWLDGIVDG
jgi:hypothetical protein